MSFFKKTCLLCHCFYIVINELCSFMSSEEQKGWWTAELQPFAFYFSTFIDPLDQERAHKRVQHIIADNKGDIGKAVQFLAQDLACGQRWNRRYAISYRDGKTYFDPTSRMWKPYSSSPVQPEQTPHPPHEENSYRTEPRIY